MGSADDAADKVGNMASLWTSGAALFFNSRLPINIPFSLDFKYVVFKMYHSPREARSLFSLERSEFLLQSVCLFHDCGYTPLPIAVKFRTNILGTKAK